MPPTKFQLMQVRLSSLKQSLSVASTQQKSNHVSLQMAKHFNSILADVVEEYPAIKDAICDQIDLRSKFQLLGATDVTYIDLEAFIDQTIAVLKLVEAE